MVLLILASTSLLLQSTSAIPLTDKDGKVTTALLICIIKPWLFKRCGNVTTLSTKTWHLSSGRRSVQATRIFLNLAFDLTTF